MVSAAVKCWSVVYQIFNTKVQTVSVALSGGRTKNKKEKKNENVVYNNDSKYMLDWIAVIYVHIKLSDQITA